MSGVLPYGRQVIAEDDIAAVVEVLRSDWLTTGPAVARFEADICAYTGATHGVAVSNGTAALHTAMHAIGIGPGDEVIVPAMTFAATSNAVLYCGGRPVFADIDPETLLLDPASVRARITPRTKAIIGVDYAGQPCDWDALRVLADAHGLPLVADACHSLGGQYKGRTVGTLADLTVFSFHPVKHITTGEGGMIVTDNAQCAARMRIFRNHGITTTAAEREKNGAWFYEMTELGYNYRITDFQCALGSAQLTKLDGWIAKRNSLAGLYNTYFANSTVRPLHVCDACRHAYHLYVVRTRRRNTVIKALRDAGIGANVHYIPVYRHPYYQHLGYSGADCPVTESAYNDLVTLPLWVGMEIADVARVASLVKAIDAP